jgi:hypothetical protein
MGALINAGQNGKGKSIGLFELASHSASDVTAYENCFGLKNPVQTVAVDGGGGAVGGNGTLEADLDIEQAATQAPGASIVAYQAPNGTANGSYDVWNAIVKADAVQAVSSSWGVCEPEAKAAGFLPSFSTLFEQAAAQGQSIFASAGDAGAEDCFTAGSSQTQAEVDYPASDPFVTAVGGTTRTASGDVVWNDCAGKESVTCAAGGGAGGGGLSRYESRPSYEPALASWPSAQSCGPCRDVPDISANAGTRMAVFDNGSWADEGGTSFAAPLLAALVADRDDGCSAPTGLFAPSLYSLFKDGAYGTAFNAVSSGNNDLTGSNAGQWSANGGDNLATGIGSPIAAGLSCPEVSSLSTSSGAVGVNIAISGLGLEHASVSFGGTAARVVATTATAATVTVPAGSGTVTVSATSPLGAGTQTSSFTYAASSTTSSSPSKPISSSGSSTTATTTATAAPPATISNSPTGALPLPAPPAVGTHGYWLVGSDGGIFSFGSAPFYGSTGALHLQRSVIGITPTSNRGGYWLVGSDGGIFSFGNAGFYGSIPKLGLAPAGTVGGKHLNAPIVGMVPTSDGRGYFMVASDGGVFAFGDALFEGSCPQIGGCSGSAVSVMPDASGQGYWLVTTTGHIYAFGNAANYGSPGPRAYPVTSAVRTPDGLGYWVLFADGAVGHYGDAASYGGASGAGGLNPARAIFTPSTGNGYWIALANGDVEAFGGAANYGDIAGKALNGSIEAASGF